MLPSDVLFVSLGDTGRGILTHLETYGVGAGGYHFLDLESVISAHLEMLNRPTPDSPIDYDTFVFEHPDVFTELKNWAKEHKRVFLLLGADPICGASLSALRSIYEAMGQSGSEIYIVLYLRGENAEPVSIVLEKHLHGIFTNKARSGFCKIFIVREDELSNVFGHILTLKDITQRYYRQIADAVHKYNLFTSSKSALTRTNPVDMMYYSERESYANIMTFSSVVMEAEKLVSIPFFDLTILKPTVDGKNTKHEEEFICLFLNLHKQIKDNLHKFLDTIKTILGREKTKKIQIDFYNISDTNTITLGVHKSTITVE